MKAKDILVRIESRLSDLGMSATRAQKAAGTPDAIRNLQRAIREGRDMPPKAATLERLAVVLQTTPAWLQSGIGEPERSAAPSLGGIKIMGTVAAGVWHEVPSSDWYNDDDLPISTFPADPRFSISAQFDLKVQGTSINLMAPEGHYLRCVKLFEFGMELQDGDIVIVQRTRDSSLVETTAKAIKKSRTGIELWPRSSDPRWQDRLLIPNGGKDQHEEIKIVAVVLFAYAPAFHR